MKMRMKRMMGLLLALFMTIGCVSLNPIASYADNTDAKTFNINQGSVNITKSGIYTIKGTGNATSNTISVTGSNITATITLNNVNIDVSNQNNQKAFLAKDYDQSKVHLTIILKGTNSLKSGSQCAGLTWNNSNNNSKLEIKGDGSLTATGGQRGAGVGSTWSTHARNITITGGTVTATGGQYAAGIGGGDEGSGNNITIAGGSVTATGGQYGAGIGGGDGWRGSGNNITITGGTVTATGGQRGADIGGGYDGSGNNIKITGGSVKASRIGTTPNDGNVNSVYLAKLENQDGVNKVTVDSGTGNAKTFKRAGNHPGGDTAFYLYLTGKEDHDLVTSKGKYKAEWNSNTNAFTIFDPANVKSMTVTTQPNKLSYTEGEKLDLTGLEVTLEDANHVKKVVTPAEFEANGITATPENGTQLTVADHNGKTVKLSKPGVRDVAETGNLIVYHQSSDSGHGAGSAGDSGSGHGSLSSPSPLPSGVGSLLPPGSLPGGTGAGAGVGVGMNDDAPTTVDKDELNIQIDSAESDSNPGYAGDGAGAAVKQAADVLDEALAQAKRVAADPNATQAQVDAATRRLADARKALADARKSQQHIGVIPKTGESASFAGLLAALGFSIAGLAILRKKKMMEENNK